MAVLGMAKYFPVKEAQRSDLNQLSLQGTDPGTHVPYNYWQPVPGEPGRLFLCGYRGSASGGGLTTLYPIYYKLTGSNYRSHIDGWNVPGDVPGGISLSGGWVFKAKWYEKNVVGKKCTAGVDLTTNTCYYLAGATIQSQVCGRLNVSGV